MKLLRAAVIVLFLASSSAAADSFYFGARFDAPIFLEQSNQTKAISASLLPTFGVQIGFDFDSLYAGPLGFRLAVSSDLNSGLRIGLDGYKRAFILPELGSYLGFGMTAISASKLFSFTFHFLAGLEYQIVPGIGVFAEINPGAALGVSCSDAGHNDCGLLVPLVLESAIGLNFRF
jgi:hypothetical protein